MSHKVHIIPDMVHQELKGEWPKSSIWGHLTNHMGIYCYIFSYNDHNRYMLALLLMFSVYVASIALLSSRERDTSYLWFSFKFLLFTFIFFLFLTRFKDKGGHNCADCNAL